MRPLTIVDSDVSFEAFDDPRVAEALGAPLVKTREAWRASLERVIAGAPAGSGTQWHDWTALLADGTPIGRIEATLHDGIAEIGYVFGPRWWGRGYATEAVGWLVDEVDRRGWGPCWAAVAPANEASIRLLRRLGFRQRDPGEAALQSFDPGDLTFVRPSS